LDDAEFLRVHTNDDPSSVGFVGAQSESHFDDHVRQLNRANIAILWLCRPVGFSREQGSSCANGLSAGMPALRLKCSDRVAARIWAALTSNKFGPLAFDLS
jgi:hypothetical protein